NVVGITSFQQPVGQSFTPSLSSVAFVRLQLLDAIAGNDLGATILINLRTNSITGPVLASTDPVLIPDGFPGPNTVGFIDFFFPVPVAVIPSVPYYFQPLIQSGDGFLAGADIMGSNYAGGTAFVRGSSITGSDLWF